MTPRYVVIFLGVTFNEIALVVMIILGLRRKCLCPLSLAKDFEAKLNKKQYQEAYDAAKDDNSFLGKVLAAGMANLSEGHEAALEAMHEVGEEQNMRLEQRNGHIALIAQIGPMLGLLATVDGIVRAFAVIAGKDVTPKPSELAQGIGIALVNTVVGLWLAIPSIIFYQHRPQSADAVGFGSGRHQLAPDEAIFQRLGGGEEVVRPHRADDLP